MAKSHESARYGACTNGAETPVWYVVKKGDTLWGIAKRLYSRGPYARRARAIEKANPGFDPAMGFDVGERILIPRIEGDTQ